MIILPQPIPLDIVVEPEVFPLFPGQTLLQGRTPMWSTTIATSSSGRERRQSRWSYPRWRYKISYEVLRQRPSLRELEQLETFFNTHMGTAVDFLFRDLTDSYVEDELLGTGNGARTLFQLQRSYNLGDRTVTEPILGSGFGTVVLVDGQRAVGATVGDRGLVTLPSAPPAGSRVSWSGPLLRRVRFFNDELTFEQMTRHLWSQGGLELLTVKR